VRAQADGGDATAEASSGARQAEPRDDQGPGPNTLDAAFPDGGSVNTTEDSLVTTLGVTAGVAARNIDVPSERGLATLRTGLVPALGLQLGVRLHGPRFFGGVALAYQSSVAARATQGNADPRAASLVTTVQAHHFAAGVAPGVLLGDSRDSAALSLFLGYGVRALASVVELNVPRFSLHGPVARIELELPLGSRSVVLRVAPEVQLLWAATPSLRRMASIGAQNWALGGEASLCIRLAAWSMAQLAYRGSRAFAPSALGGAFEDVEHFASLGIVFRYF
jgi:hypothetical protein